MAQRNLDPHLTHASSVNQVEIHFSIVQRKVTPNDFSSLADLEQRLLAI